MDRVWFDALPALCKSRKYDFEEIHVLNCPPPRPVAVKVSQGHRQVPEDLWPVGDLAVRALQGADAFEVEPCQIGAFLTQLLCKAIGEAGIMETGPCLDGRALLSLLAARATRTLAKESKQANMTHAKSAKGTKAEVPQHTRKVHELAIELSHPSFVADKPQRAEEDLEQAEQTEINGPSVAETGAAGTDEEHENQPGKQEVATESKEEDPTHDRAELVPGTCAEATVKAEPNEQHKSQPGKQEVATDSEEEEPKQNSAALVPGTDAEATVNAEPNEQCTRQETAKQRRRKRRRERLRKVA